MSQKSKQSIRRADKLRRKNFWLAACCMVAVVVIAVLLLIPKQESQTAQFTPPPFDAAVVRGKPEAPEELGWSEMQIRDGLTASVCGVLNEADGKVAVWLYNHADSDCWIKLRMLDSEGNILGETGLLKPGEYVQYLNLDTVPKKNTTVVLKLMAYQPETYYSGGSLGLETTLVVE